jgi:hypothetical protein
MKKRLTMFHMHVPGRWWHASLGADLHGGRPGFLDERRGYRGRSDQCLQNMLGIEERNRSHLPPTCAYEGILPPPPPSWLGVSSTRRSYLDGLEDSPPSARGISIGVCRPWDLSIGEPRLEVRKRPHDEETGRQSCPPSHVPLTRGHRSSRDLCLPFLHCPTRDTPISLSLLTCPRGPVRHVSPPALRHS